MCGRFSLAVEATRIMERFCLDEIPFAYSPRYNIAPGQPIVAIIAVQGKRRIGQLRWGLVPAWSKEKKGGFKMINARAETLWEKPMFRKLVDRKRCIIPADGFYEWKQGERGKRPLRIVLKSGELFAFAGLYDTWSGTDGEKLHTCTIITTQPNEVVAEIHNRMPVILRREDENLWLDREHTDVARLRSLLMPYDAAAMRAYPVAPLVGNPQHDLPACIEEVAWD